MAATFDSDYSKLLRLRSLGRTDDGLRAARGWRGPPGRGGEWKEAETGSNGDWKGPTATGKQIIKTRKG